MHKIVIICQILVIFVNLAEFNQDFETCSKSANYQECLDWVSADKNSKELWTWIDSQKKRKFVSFCKDKAESEISPDNEFIKGPFPCPDEGSNVKFDGKFNDKNLPTGRALV